MNDRTSPHLLIDDRCEDRLVIKLNSPDVRNPVDSSIVAALHEVCTELERRPKIAILCGAAGNFAAGADMKELRTRGPFDALAGASSSMFNRIQRLPMPVVALLDGWALGGGAELAYACDFRIGTARLKIGNPQPSLGSITGAGATWRLRELVGETVAKEMLLAGRVLDGHEARQVGLLNEVVDPEHLETAGHRLADQIARVAPLAVRITKQAFHAPREAHPLLDDLTQAVLLETSENF